MRAALFHFMNMLRIPIMFASKLFLWIAVLIAFMCWGAYLEWFDGPYKNKDPLAGGILFTAISVGLYYFRHQYDVLLVRLNPHKQGVAFSKGDSHVFGASKNKSEIIGKE